MSRTKKLSKKEFVESTIDALNKELGGRHLPISIISKEQFDSVIDVITDAFQKDPAMIWLASEARDETNEVQQMIKYLCSWINRPILIRGKGIVIGVKDDGRGEIRHTASGTTLQNNNDRIVGAVSLLPSSQENDSIIDVLSNALSLGIPPMHKSRWKKLYGPISAQRLDYTDILKKKQKHIMLQTLKHPKFIYVQQIGVLTEFQGKGVGKKLLNMVIQIAESLGDTALYLETESEENESLYKHFGFKTIETIDMVVPGDNHTDAKQTMWLMVRAPK